MTSQSSTKDTSGKPDSGTEDPEPRPVIPLRQRNLPASFWQEPCLAPSASGSGILHQATAISPIQQFPVPSLHPWTMNATSGLFPAFLPQRVSLPSALVMAHASSPLWIRNPAATCCSCAACMNYSYMLPRVQDVYGGMRYRPPLIAPCCPGTNCMDQSCKMCSSVADAWHPERLRQIRLRSARYNALVD